MKNSISILFKPRTVFRSVLGSGKCSVLLPALLAGIAHRFFILFSSGEAADIEPAGFALSLLVGGLLTGVVLVYLMGALLALLGRRMLGGTGTVRELQAATAWGLVPLAWTSMIWLIVLAVGGLDVFGIDPESTTGLTAFHPLVGLLVASTDIFVVWSVFTLSKTVGEAHHFSAWKGLLNLLLPALLLMLVGVVLAMLLPAILSFTSGS